jgi:hypothetical protein
MREVIGRWWLRVVLATVVVMVAIQFVPFRVDNPSARDEPAWDSTATRDLAVRACYDCHSNETDVLWFEQVAPLQWVITNHVEEGRSALNFSEWNTDAGRKADDAAEVTDKGEMPPNYYTWFGLHTDAKLTDAETRQLVAGLEATLRADPPAGGESGGEGDGDGD